MAHGLENFDLPENLHERNPPSANRCLGCQTPGRKSRDGRCSVCNVDTPEELQVRIEENLEAEANRDAPARNYWLDRTNRRNYLLWLASHMRLPHPREDQGPWYALSEDDVTRPPIPGCRPMGLGVMRWDEFNSGLARSYMLVIIDAFPEVQWDIWRFEGSFIRRKQETNSFQGYALPHPDVERVYDNSPLIEISGRDICRGYILELARRLGIPTDPSVWNEMSWNNIPYRRVFSLSPPMPKFKSFLARGCPVSMSLFSALDTYFDDVDFIWRPWLVGSNSPVGFANRTIVGDERAREDIKELLSWIVQRIYHEVLGDENLELLYEISQRTISEWFGGIMNRPWDGSPQAMIEFAYSNGPDGSEWDPTRFGSNSERQTRFYRDLRSQLTSEELALMDEQEKQGLRRSMIEFGLYPLTQSEDGTYFGGSRIERMEVGLNGQSKNPEADIWLDSRNLMVDVLGEDHFDETLSRSNERTEADVRRRFLQRQIQDRQRWELCWRAGYHVIAIGPELGIDDEGLAEFREALTLTIGEGPSFQALGWPDNSDPPEFE